MNLRFLRAQYSRSAAGPTPADQYQWSYFPETSVIVKFFPTAIGSYSLTSAADRREQLAKEVGASVAAMANVQKVTERDISSGDELGKEFEVVRDGATMLMRVFVNNGIYYLIVAEVKQPEARALIEKLLNSFELIPLPASVAAVEKDVFTSVAGAFSIEIPQMPART